MLFYILVHAVSYLPQKDGQKVSIRWYYGFDGLLISAQDKYYLFLLL